MRGKPRFLIFRTLIPIKNRGLFLRKKIFFRWRGILALKCVFSKKIFDFAARNLYFLQIVSMLDKQSPKRSGDFEFSTVC